MLFLLSLLACTPSQDSESTEESQETGHTGEGHAPLEVDLSDAREVVLYGHTARSLAVDGGHLFIPDNAEDRVLVYDVDTLAQVAAIPTGDFPYVLTVGEGMVAVSNAYDTTATVIDSSQATKVRDVEVGEFPWGVAIAGGQLYATLPTAGDPYVQRVSTQTWQGAGRFDAESGPGKLVAAAEHLVLLNGRSVSDPEDDALSVHTLDGELVTRLETGGAPYDLVEHEGLVYASMATRDEVVQLDPGSQQLGWSFGTGAAPNGLAACGEWVLVVSKDEASLTVARPSTSESWTAPLLPSVHEPRGLACARNGTVFVEHQAGVTAWVGALPAM